MTSTNISLTKIHSYNVSVAADVGINAAVIFYNICYWVEENTANERNRVNGEYWTYNTINAFKTLFPEMTYEQVRNALRKLENNGYIKSAFLNEDARDRTKWYTVCDTDKWILSSKCICGNSHTESEQSHMDCEKSQMRCENTQLFNNNINNIGIESNNKQAYDKRTNNSHNSLSPERASESDPPKPKRQSRKKEANELFERIWKLYPKKLGKGQVSDTQKLKLLDVGYDELERAIQRCCMHNKDRDKQYWQNGSTFFNSGYIDFLDENYEDSSSFSSAEMNEPKKEPLSERERIRLGIEKARETFGEEYGESYWNGMDDGEIYGMLGLLGIDVDKL